MKYLLAFLLCLACSSSPSPSNLYALSESDLQGCTPGGQPSAGTGGGATAGTDAGGATAGTGVGGTDVGGTAGSATGGVATSGAAGEGAAPGEAGAPPAPPVRPVVAIVLAGQSDVVGMALDSVPAGIPTDAVPYWLGNAFVLGSLRVAPNGTFGPELSLALALEAVGRDVVIIKIARGNTFMTDWLPSAASGAALVTQVKKFVPAIKTRFPGREFSWHFLWGQGANEALSGTADAIAHWASNYRIVGDAVRGACACTTVEHVSLTDLDLHSFPYVAAVRAQQIATGARLVEETGIPLLTDGHFTGAGEVIYGQRFAADVIASEP